MAKRDPDTILSDLQRADKRVQVAAHTYGQATSVRTDLILEASEFGISRATIARHLGISSSRVQQILDRAVAQRSREV